MKVKLNIGMGNSPLLWIDISRRLAYHTHGIQVSSTQFIEASGVWRGIEEDVLVVKLKKVKYNLPQLKNFLELLAMALNQEAIAVKVPKFDYQALIFNPTYEGEKYEFDDSLFLD